MWNDDYWDNERIREYYEDRDEWSDRESRRFDYELDRADDRYDEEREWQW